MPRNKSKPTARAKRLQGIALFADCTAAELAAVDTLLACARVREGEVLLRERAVGRQFMIIEDGWARVVGGGVALGILGPGSFFGEMSLLDGQPRSATVIAASDMIVDVLNPAEFEALLEAAPSVRLKVQSAADARRSR